MPKPLKDRNHVIEWSLIFTREFADGPLSDLEVTSVRDALTAAAKGLIDKHGLSLVNNNRRDHHHTPDLSTLKIVVEEGETFLDLKCSTCQEWGSRKLSGKAEEFEW